MSQPKVGPAFPKVSKSKQKNKLKKVLSQMPNRFNQEDVGVREGRLTTRGSISKRLDPDLSQFSTASFIPDVSEHSFRFKSGWIPMGGKKFDTERESLFRSPKHYMFEAGS